MGWGPLPNESWESIAYQAVRCKRVNSQHSSFTLKLNCYNQFPNFYFCRAEIRVQFRHVPGNLYKRSFGTDLDRATNELVIRVQPDEAIYLKINNKIPGLGMKLDRSNLNLLYSSRYENTFRIKILCQ